MRRRWKPCAKPVGRSRASDCGDQRRRDQYFVLPDRTNLESEPAYDCPCAQSGLQRAAVQYAGTAGIVHDHQSGSFRPRTRFFRLLQFPSFLRRETFAKGRVEIVELKVFEDGKLNGVRLSELYKIAKVKVLVCAVSRGGEVEILNGDYRLQTGDHIYVTADVGQPVTAAEKPWYWDELRQPCSSGGRKPPFVSFWRNGFLVRRRTG